MIYFQPSQIGGLGGKGGKNPLCMRGVWTKYYNIPVPSTLVCDGGMPNHKP